MTAREPLLFTKSTYSQQGGAVCLGLLLQDFVYLRDTKAPRGPRLRMDYDTWRGFTEAVATGQPSTSTVMYAQDALGVSVGIAPCHAAPSLQPLRMEGLHAGGREWSGYQALVSERAGPSAHIAPLDLTLPGADCQNSGLELLVLSPSSGHSCANSIGRLVLIDYFSDIAKRSPRMRSICSANPPLLSAILCSSMKRSR